MKNDDELKVVNLKKKINRYFKQQDLRNYYIMYIEVSNLHTYSLFYDISLSSKILQKVYNDLQKIFDKNCVFLYRSDQIIVINEFKNKVVFDKRDCYDEQRRRCQEIINYITHQKYSLHGSDEYYNVSLTIGCGSMGLVFKKKDIESLIRLAHFTMIKAKEKNLNYLIADEAIRTVKMDLDDFNLEIEKGFKLDEFSPFFIPILCPKTLKIIGCESLARWRKDKYRVIEAAKFKEIAIEKNLFVKIDQRVIEKTFQAYLKWASLHLLQDNFKISINLSKNSLITLEPEKLSQTLVDYKLQPQNIEFDISLEGEVLEDEIDMIKQLKEHGFRVAIDVVNFQNISFDILRNIDIDTIKISRVGLFNGELIPQEQRFCRMLVKISRVMGFRIMAKGIETENELALTTKLNVDYVQGYYFTKPLDEYNFGIYLNKYKNGIHFIE